VDKTCQVCEDPQQNKVGQFCGEFVSKQASLFHKNNEMMN
jgi:hypothetical protein